MSYGSNLNERIVYFDDKCILCNKSVAFILKWEKDFTLKFSAINTDKYLYENYGDKKEADTIIFKEGEHYYIKSTAVLKIAGYLKGIFPLFEIFLIVPVKIRDFIYDFIARNRYDWFGTTDQCILTTSELKDRLIQ